MPTTVQYRVELSTYVGKYSSTDWAYKTGAGADGRVGRESLTKCNPFTIMYEPEPLDQFGLGSLFLIYQTSMIAL